MVSFCHISSGLHHILTHPGSLVTSAASKWEEKLSSHDANMEELQGYQALKLGSPQEVKKAFLELHGKAKQDGQMKAALVSKVHALETRIFELEFELKQKEDGPVQDEGEETAVTAAGEQDLGAMMDELRGTE